ncbi:hypothetical protein [Bacterioplanoides sp. SCSIO 12839]|uniref:hypothetical protein n=1 Tax=Bacterioplanoides sp. SCSIO 12839 TaxID=2829569 RepID=UPI0021044FD7|nr:hypothetical protein [Bacterioplanoides sp. SCSIO 12839]UTW47806.1 hypothetical protein KFF03_14740 [Bacterioplanoides sp. SCSIO 12839]
MKLSHLRYCAPIVLLSLTACSAKLASIKVPADLATQAPQALTTDGEFWGLGMDGTFDLAGLYHGKYDREASGSSYFGDFISNDEGSMAAEVVNSQSQQRWLLNCAGENTSVNLGGLSFGGDSPYECEVTSADKNKVGNFILKKSSGLIDFGPTGKVSGSLTLDGKRFEVESIHDMEGSFIPSDQPLGYYIKKNGQTVAAIQVNGRITLQSDGADMDAYAIATVASSLSVRPEE